jgi:hypothetical protein
MGMNLTSHLYLTSRLRTVGAILLSPIHLRDLDTGFTILRIHFCLPLRVCYSNDKDGDDDDDNDYDDIRE